MRQTESIFYLRHRKFRTIEIKIYVEIKDQGRQTRQNSGWVAEVANIDGSSFKKGHCSAFLRKAIKKGHFYEYLRY